MPESERELCPDCGTDITEQAEECPVCRVDLVYCESDAECPGRYPGWRAACHLCGTPNLHVGKYGKPAGSEPPAAPTAEAQGTAPPRSPERPVAGPAPEPTAAPADSLPPNFLSILLAQTAVLRKSVPAAAARPAPPPAAAPAAPVAAPVATA